MISGTYHFGKKLVSCRNAYCSVCDEPRFFEGRRSLVVFHLMFIPLLPIGTKVRFFCTRCDIDLDSQRPSRPFILRAGVLAGLVFTAVGAFGLYTGREPWIFLVGAAFTTWLIWLLRQKRYPTFRTNQASVTPLASNACPYCRRHLLPSENPYCHDCRVKIITSL